MDIIGKSKLFVSISVILVLLSWASLAVFGLKPGIDLSGGTEWQVRFSGREVKSSEVSSYLASEFGVEASAKTISTGDIIIRLPDISEEKHQEYKKALADEFGGIEEKSFASVGPVIGRELRRKAVWAVISVLLGISLFVAWAFRKVSRSVNSWKYGIVTLIALLHDVSIPTGLMALLGHFYGVEVDTTFIVALLVILGYSVNDTIVVMDRIRENLNLNRGRKIKLKEIINKSVNETIMRSVNTSFTLIVVLLCLIFFGPQSLFYFVLTILVGTVVGTYSSIFLASPILYFWSRGKQI